MILFNYNQCVNEFYPGSEKEAEAKKSYDEVSSSQ